MADTQQEAPVFCGACADVIQALELENGLLRDTLATAADDLAKAANQFAGLVTAPELARGGINAERFAEKAQRAREALNGTTSPSHCGVSGEGVALENAHLRDIVDRALRVAETERAAGTIQVLQEFDLFAGLYANRTEQKGER